MRRAPTVYERRHRGNRPLELRRIFAATLVWLFAVVAGQAAVLDVVGGQLLGATGVNVNDTLYDVEFKDGTCVALYDGCDDNSDFTFQSESDALAASQALLDQVFVNDLMGSFDTDPSLTEGCTWILNCLALTPFDIDQSTGILSVAAANNRWNSEPDSLLTAPDQSPVTNFQSREDIVYAKWTTPYPVPLPAGLPLVPTGLGALAVLQWRRKRAAQV